MLSHTSNSRRWLLAAAPLLLSAAVRADCECGYSIGGSGDDRHVFTDLLESDFVHLDLKKEGIDYGQYGWAAQQFDMAKDTARGPFGESFATDNVVSNFIDDTARYDGDGSQGADPGVRLTVKSQKTADYMVPSAEISTVDLDYYYGTFRAGIKVTGVAGTCSAFFWYFNDTQEIDMEFLSSQFRHENSSYPVNLVLQSAQSQDAGYDARGTRTFQTVNLPFDPTAAFHEYRFDYLPGSVAFYADGKKLASMNNSDNRAHSHQPGHLLLSHWSNGNDGWSQGPPTEDAITTVSYVKSYYNSSSTERQSDYRSRCADPTAQGAICEVRDNDPTYFFTNEDGMAPNQTNTSNGGEGAEGSGASALGAGMARFAALVVSAAVGLVVV